MSPVLGCFYVTLSPISSPHFELPLFPLSGPRPAFRARRLRKERHKGSAKTVAHQQKGQLMQRCGDEETDTEEQGDDAQEDLGTGRGAQLMLLIKGKTFCWCCMYFTFGLMVMVTMMESYNQQT